MALMALHLSAVVLDIKETYLSSSFMSFSKVNMKGLVCLFEEYLKAGFLCIKRVFSPPET